MQSSSRHQAPTPVSGSPSPRPTSRNLQKLAQPQAEVRSSLDDLDGTSRVSAGFSQVRYPYPRSKGKCPQSCRAKYRLQHADSPRSNGGIKGQASSCNLRLNHRRLHENTRWVRQLIPAQLPMLRGKSRGGRAVQKNSVLLDSVPVVNRIFKRLTHISTYNTRTFRPKRRIPSYTSLHVEVHLIRNLHFPQEPCSSRFPCKVSNCFLRVPCGAPYILQM